MSKRNAPTPARTTVRLDKPGVIAVGDYRAGVDYDVDAETARRLLRRGFRRVTAKQQEADTNA